MLLVVQKLKDKGSVLTIHESPTAASLKEIAITLNLGKPLDNISAEALFIKIIRVSMGLFATFPMDLSV